MEGERTITHMDPAKRIIVIAAFTLVSCSSQVIPAATPTSNSTTIRFDASHAMAPLLNDLTTEYTHTNPNLSFEIDTSHQATLRQQVEENTVPYFLSNHFPPESNLWAAPVGQDGIAIIVHPENPLESISTEAIRNIYQGITSNWQDVSGVNMPIQVMSREDGSSTRMELDRLLLGDRVTTAAALILPSNEAMLESVALNPESIGYLSFRYLTPGIQPLKVDNIAPTRENLSNNTYPLRSTIFVLGKNEPQNEYRQFIGWIQSQNGQIVVGKRYAPLVISQP